MVIGLPVLWLAAEADRAGTAAIAEPVLIVLVAGLLILVITRTVAGRHPGDAFLIYIGVALLGTTLPIVIWAWREPDPPEPEPSAT